MNITYELRRLLEGLDLTDETTKQIDEAVDRIDSDYLTCEKFCRRLEDAASKGEEVTLFGTDYIPLPKDAYGVTIHLGDMLEIEHGHGVLDSGEVTDIHLQVGKYVVSIGFGDEEGVTAYPEDYRHAKPDSWESIIEDARVCLMSDYKTEATPTMRWKLNPEELVGRCKRLAGEDA